MSSSSRIKLEAYLKGLHVKADAVLDVGGSQNPVTKRLGSFEAKTYMVADLVMPHHVIKNPDIHVDLNKKVQFNGTHKEQFDVVFCLEVMEYIWNPVQAIQNLAYFLKKGGKLYISFCMSYPIHPPQGLDYLRYTHYGAIKMLKECGFQVNDLVLRDAANPRGYIDWCNSEGFRYDKGITSGEMSAVGSIIECIKL